MHEALTTQFPTYRAMTPSAEALWTQPANGLLTGVVTSKENDEEFVVQDVKGVLWRVESYAPEMKEVVEPEIGMRLKIIGVAYGSNEFYAVEFRLWNPRGAR